MADSMISSGLDITNRNRYSNYNTQEDFDPTINRWEEQERLDKLYTDKSTLSFTDMLSLMVTQFQNQTIDNQASTTDMMNQLVQMSTMQAMTDMTTQMKELALANVMSYSASLVGQTVTIGVYNAETKELEEIVGVVEGAGTYDGQQVIFVDGKSYLLSSIMAVGKLPPRVEEDEKPGEDGDEDGDKVDGTEPGDGNGEDGDKVDGTEPGGDTDGTESGGGTESGSQPEVG